RGADRLSAGDRTGVGHAAVAMAAEACPTLRRSVAPDVGAVADRRRTRRAGGTGAGGAGARALLFAAAQGLRQRISPGGRDCRSAAWRARHPSPPRALLPRRDDGDVARPFDLRTHVLLHRPPQGHLPPLAD